MKRFVRPAMLGIALATLSACGQPETVRSVSDFCLLSKRVTVSVAPAPSVNDPGNTFDTDETVNQVLEANNVFDRLCPEKN